MQRSCSLSLFCFLVCFVFVCVPLCSDIVKLSIQRPLMSSLRPLGQGATRIRGCLDHLVSCTGPLCLIVAGPPHHHHHTLLKAVAVLCTGLCQPEWALHALSRKKFLERKGYELMRSNSKLIVLFCYTCFHIIDSSVSQPLMQAAYAAECTKKKKKKRNYRRTQIVCVCVVCVML